MQCNGKSKFMKRAAGLIGGGSGGRVVARVLGQIWEETNLDFEVADLSMAVKPFRFLCKLHGRKEGVKYGQMVVPFLPNNFGPMYFCKINRV